MDGWMCVSVRMHVWMHACSPFVDDRTPTRTYNAYLRTFRAEVASFLDECPKDVFYRIKGNIVLRDEEEGEAGVAAGGEAEKKQREQKEDKANKAKAEENTRNDDSGGRDGDYGDAGVVTTATAHGDGSVQAGASPYILNFAFGRYELIKLQTSPSSSLGMGTRITLMGRDMKRKRKFVRTQLGLTRDQLTYTSREK